MIPIVLTEVNAEREIPHSSSKNKLGIDMAEVIPVQTGSSTLGPLVKVSSVSAFLGRSLGLTRRLRSFRIGFDGDKFRHSN